MPLSNNNQYVFVTSKMLNDARTSAGGYTRAQIEALGVKYPPKRGWLQSFVGKKIPSEQWQSFVSAANTRAAKKNKLPQSQNQPKHAPSPQISLLKNKIEAIKEATLTLAEVCEKKESNLKSDPEFVRAFGRLWSIVQPRSHDI